MDMYKAEFFGRDYQYLASAPIPAPQIAFDYLTLDGCTLAMPKRAIAKGCYVQISGSTGAVVHQGIVRDVQSQSGVMDIQIAPLLSLLDIPVRIGPDRLKGEAIEGFIAAMAQEAYLYSTDHLQNIPGLVCRVNSATPAHFSFDSPIHGLWDICAQALSIYGVAATAALDVEGKALVLYIGRVDGVRTIEADLTNCLAKSISIGDSFTGCNKATLYSEDGTQVVTYYLHTDGSISTADADRVLPVIFTLDTVGGNDFEADAYGRAVQLLMPEIGNNLIELSYAIGDKLVRPESLAIGQLVDIRADGAVYRSMLTGWERGTKVCKLVFGNIRLDITKKLSMERRR